jgi:hypothetical protein
MFELKLSDGKIIPLKWGYYAMKRFGKRANMGATEYFSNLNSGDKLFEHMDNILLSAAEYGLATKGEPFEYTLLDSSAWIDDVGGFAPEGQIMGFISHLLSTHSVNLTEKQNDEKKN